MRRGDTRKVGHRRIPRESLTSPRPLLSPCRRHKGVPGYRPWGLWRSSYRKICSLRCRQMYLLCSVSGATVGASVASMSWNKFATKRERARSGREERRERDKERNEEKGCMVDIRCVTIARETPAFSLSAKTSGVQAVRPENLHPRGISQSPVARSSRPYRLLN